MNALIPKMQICLFLLEVSRVKWTGIDVLGGHDQSPSLKIQFDPKMLQPQRGGVLTLDQAYTHTSDT